MILTAHFLKRIAACKNHSFEKLKRVWTMLLWCKEEYLTACLENIYNLNTLKWSLHVLKHSYNLRKFKVDKKSSKSRKVNEIVATVPSNWNYQNLLWSELQIKIIIWEMLNHSYNNQIGNFQRRNVASSTKVAARE